MKHSPYSGYSKKDLMLTDLLAVDRTILANERNLLAYIRTSLGFLIAGATLIHFFKILLLQITGWVLIPLGFIILLVGIKRYRSVKYSIERIKLDATGEKSEDETRITQK